MKTRKLDFYFSIGIVILGIFLLCAQFLNITNITFLYRLFLGVFFVIELGKFILLYKTKDITNFFSFLISFLLFAISFFYDFTKTSKIFSYSLLLWIFVMSLVKLKKADYYHDRRSKVWYIEVSFLVLFLLSGVLTVLHLDNTRIDIVLGYFAFICGILDVCESLLLMITKGKLK